MLHEEMKNDFWGTMQHIAEIGYQGIEGGYFLLEGDVAANLARFHALGLRVITTGTRRENLIDDIDSVIRQAHKLQASQVAIYWAPSDSKEQLLADAELYNTAGARLAEEGLLFIYHNHEHEFTHTFDGLYGFDVLVANTDPRYFSFEIDTAWAFFGGEDPARLIKRLGNRVASLHIKDLYDISERGHFTAVGTGIAKAIEAVRAAIEVGVEWGFVEQDRLRTLSPFDTAAVSYLNLKEAGLVM